MGGIGSAPPPGSGGISSGELLSSLGGGLSSAASNASWFLGKAADTASAVKAAAKEKIHDKLQERQRLRLSVVEQACLNEEL